MVQDRNILRHIMKIERKHQVVAESTHTHLMAATLAKLNKQRVLKQYPVAVSFNKLLIV